jgi:RNA polymerase sigma factor (TIGR02999 family)
MVYDELRRLAHARLSREAGPQLLQPTELVHEAYLRLIRQQRLEWKSRTHFYGVAAHLMRLILVDWARRDHCAKRGGPNACRVDLSHVEAPGKALDADALAQALERLSKLDPRQSRIVEMRYFGGLTVEETAEALEISAKTVRRDWEVARAWLHGELRKEAREP